MTVDKERAVDTCTLSLGSLLIETTTASLYPNCDIMI